MKTNPGPRASRKARRERGAATAELLIVLPLLIGLLLVLIDVGVMFSNRATVNNVLRDTTRKVAADGGDQNTRVRPGGAKFSAEATATLKAMCAKSNQCKGTPRVTCTPQVANYAGTLVTCTVNYPYKGINDGMTKWLGFSGLTKPFVLTASARAETGRLG